MARRGVRSLRGDYNRRGDMEPSEQKELAALLKIDNGIKDAKRRYELRKFNNQREAGRLNQERTAQRRNENKQGMHR